MEKQNSQKMKLRLIVNVLCIKLMLFKSVEKAKQKKPPKNEYFLFLFPEKFQMEYEMTMLIQAFWGELVCFLRICIVLCQEYWKHYENTNIASVDWFFVEKKRNTWKNISEYWKDL